MLLQFRKTEDELFFGGGRSVRSIQVSVLDRLKVGKNFKIIYLLNQVGRQELASIGVQTTTIEVITDRLGFERNLLNLGATLTVSAPTCTQQRLLHGTGVAHINAILLHD